MTSIVARQHRFHVGKSPFAHNFLVLLDDDGNQLTELHGLPKDVLGQPLDKGRSSENLGVFEFTGPKPRYNHVAEQTLWQGPLEETMAKWRKAKAAGIGIDNSKPIYNWAGSDMNGPRDRDAPIPDVIAGNSNSVYRTLIDAMGLKMPNLPIMAPGTETPLIKGGLLEQPQPNAGLLSPGRRGLLGPI